MSLVYQSVAATRRLIGTRQVSCEEVVAAHLNRIDALNPDLNALAYWDAEGAVSEARQLDLAIRRGATSGPLTGIPVTVKDLYEVRGMPSTSGTLGRVGFRPERDATAVSRLRRAGAIVIGKSNTPEFGMALETTNLVCGTTNNPYDLARTPGGSSGGATAALAAGFSTLEIGSDGGGSLRIPAHFCGVASMKPTSRRVSCAGHFPMLSGVAMNMAGFGPLARTVGDLGVAFQLLVGEDVLDPNALPSLGEPDCDKPIRNLRVGFCIDNGIRSPTKETVNMVESCARALQGAGAHVEPACLPELGDAQDIHLGFVIADRSLVYEWKKAAGTERLHPWVQAGLEYLEEAAENFDSNTPSLLHDDCEQFKAHASLFMESYDILLGPVAPGPALPHGELSAEGNLDWTSYTSVHNLTGWPAAVVRCGTSPEGLPLGVQIVARSFRDLLVLRVAAFLEREFGGFAQPSALGKETL